MRTIFYICNKFITFCNFFLQILRQYLFYLETILLRLSCEMIFYLVSVIIYIASVGTRLQYSLPFSSSYQFLLFTFIFISRTNTIEAYFYNCILFCSMHIYLFTSCQFKVCKTDIESSHFLSLFEQTYILGLVWFEISYSSVIFKNLFQMCQSPCKQT